MQSCCTWRRVVVVLFTQLCVCWKMALIVLAAIFFSICADAQRSAFDFRRPPPRPLFPSKEPTLLDNKQTDLLKRVDSTKRKSFFDEAVISWQRSSECTRNTVDGFLGASGVAEALAEVRVNEVCIEGSGA